MGRIRSIKPEVHTSRLVASLPDEAWRTLFGLFSLVDDEGRFAADVDLIVAQIFWAAPRSADRVRKALEQLADRKLVTLYTVDGGEYLAINGWRDPSSPFGQKVDKPSPPRFPAPPDRESTDDQPTLFAIEIPTDEPPSLLPRSKLDVDADAISSAAVNAINALARTSYKPDAEATLKMSRALARDGISPEDVVAAVEHVGRPWVGHPVFADKIRPKTLLQLDRVRSALDDIRSAAPGTRKGPLVGTDTGQVVINGVAYDAPEAS